MSARPVAFPARRAGIRTWVVALGVVVGAALLGGLVAEEPRFLHLGGALDLRALGALLIGLGLGALILLYPGSGLELLVAFVYLNLSQVLVRYHQLPSILQLVAVPLFFGAWLRRGQADLVRLLTRPLTAFLVLYGLLLLGSSALARDAKLADERVLDNLKSLGVYLLVALLGWSTHAVRRGVWALLASGTLLGAIVVTQVVTADFREEYLGLARIKYAQIYGDVFEPRIAGPLGDPNFFAQILVILVPLALFMAWEERNAAKRAAALLAGTLVTAAAILTYSRGGALALACVLGLSLLARRVHLRQLAFGVGLLVLLALLLPTGFARRLETFTQFLPGQEKVLRPDSSFEQRKLFARVAWRIFLDHPLLGVGAGNYTLHFDEYAEEVGSVSREYEDLGQLHYPHNLYLEIAAETGILGLFAFVAALAAGLSTLRTAATRFRLAGDIGSASVCRAFEIAIVGYLVSSLFLHGHFARYLWMLLGFAAALDHLAAGIPAPRSQDSEGEAVA